MAIQKLELNTGEPRWYGNVQIGVLLVLVFALFINPVQTEYALGVLFLAALVVTRDQKIRKRRAKFVRLLIGSEFSVSLFDIAGNEYPAEISGGCWVSRKMVLVPVRMINGNKFQFVVSADRNDPNTFRRFIVICRFGFAVADSERHNVAHFNPQGSIK